MTASPVKGEAVAGTPALALLKRDRSRLSSCLLGPVIGLCFFAAAQTATAQQTGVDDSTLTPVPLAPLSLFPLDSDEDKTREAEAVEAEEKERNGIEINRLSTMTPETVGLLSPGAGGYGLDLWEGSRRTTVERLLPLISADLASPALRDMMRRLLLSEAAAPELQPGEEIGESLLVLRAWALLELGEINALDQLLGLVPATTNDQEEIAQLRYTTALLKGERESACIIVRNVLPRFETSLFWQEAQVTCHVLQNNESAAVLGLDMLREGGGLNPAFEQVINAALGYGEVTDFGSVDPLGKALLVQAGLGPNEESPRQFSPGELMWLAQQEQLSPEVRLPYAERATAQGALPAGQLATLYGSLSFSEGERATALSLTDSLSGPRARALLYQTAQRQKIAAARAEILATALAMAQEGSVEQPMSRVLAPMIREIPALPELDWFAAPALRALLLAGDYVGAETWWELARQASLRNPDVAVALDQLWPLIQLADLDATRPLDVAGWAEGSENQDPGMLSQHKTLLQGLLLALEEETTQQWADLVDPEGLAEPMADAAVVFALIQASANHRIGESLLLTSLLLGQDGPGNSHAAALSVAVQSLARLGLITEARSLAIEAAAHRGL